MSTWDEIQRNYQRAQALAKQAKQLQQELADEYHRSSIILSSLRSLCQGKNGDLKRCSCGKVYRLAEWEQLHQAGWQEFPSCSGEMRNCVCHSTLFLKARSK